MAASRRGVKVELLWPCYLTGGYYTCSVHDQPCLRSGGDQVTESTTFWIAGNAFARVSTFRRIISVRYPTFEAFFANQRQDSGLHASVLSIVSRLVIPFPVRLSILHSPDGFIRDLSDSEMIVCPALHLTRRSTFLGAFSYGKPHL